MNRTLEGLLHRYHLSLFEAVELVFPPIVNEIKRYPEPMADMYMYFRQAWGPFAQGPATLTNSSARWTRSACAPSGSASAQTASSSLRRKV